MLSFFEVIRNKDIFIKLQWLQFMKIHNVFNFNLLEKVLSDLLTN